MIGRSCGREGARRDREAELYYLCYIFQIIMTKLARFTEFSRKIVAVGRNYSEHAAELGNAVPTKPLLFMKVIFMFFFQLKSTILMSSHPQP
jgi:2-keto-4-pentenoate hydratase/2-oxohepta-3-ene-1,7-dioic acid hydratase in catechol pathway